MKRVKIRKIGGSTWYELPAGLYGIKITGNALDTSTSGRDNDTGDMMRTKLGEKLAFSITIPETTNTEGAAIKDIIMDKEFVAYFPNPCSGTWDTKNFYCASVPFEIDRIYSDDTWINKEVQCEWVEI